MTSESANFLGDNNMSIEQDYLSLADFLKAYLTDPIDEADDLEVAKEFAITAPPSLVAAVSYQCQAMLSEKTFPWIELGHISNRHFQTQEEAYEWLADLSSMLNSSQTQ
jgi:hypothetical protein